jgi:hypothetical protein
MNKAFVREPDALGDHCPHCGSMGQTVGSEVLRCYLTPEQCKTLAEPASFCPSPRCEVVYFDGFERMVTAKEIAKPIYPKNPDAPLCACTGLTRHEIELDIAEGSVARVRAVIEKAKSPDARCSHLAANGQSCAPYVQKYYMDCKNR